MQKRMAQISKYNTYFIQPGMMVKIIKSDLIPIGTICMVMDRKPYYDKYHRWMYDVVYLDNGLVTEVNNCQLL